MEGGHRRDTRSENRDEGGRIAVGAEAMVDWRTNTHLEVPLNLTIGGRLLIPLIEARNLDL